MPEKIHSRKTSGFIEKTMLAVIAAIKESVSNEEIAGRSGLLQKCDPRFKCLGVTILLSAALIAKNSWMLLGIYAITIIAAMFSSIALRFFLKRTLLFIPIFSFCIVVPAIFSFVTPGEPVLSIQIAAHTVCVTRQGIDSAIIFFMRVLASVSLAVLLVLTTRHTVLLKVLRIFFVPQIFVMTLGMCYRYIYLFLDIIQNMYTAIKSRVGYVASTTTGRKVVATNIAGLWLRSYKMQAEVYTAMLARGYTGEPVVLDEFKIHTTDYLLLAATVVALIGTLCLNRFLN